MKPVGFVMWVAAIATALVFIAGDALVIPNIMRPLFKDYLQDHMRDELRLLPAALFYLIHVGGLIHFAVKPALLVASMRLAFINGAVLGLVAYSCYEMTSWTIMTNWHVNLVLVDTAWGVLISAVSAWAGAMAGQFNLRHRPIKSDDDERKV